MDTRAFYTQTAGIYDIRHESPTTKVLRKLEKKAIERFAKGLVLDAGCGTGAWLEKASIGMDISETMLKTATDRGKALIQGNIEKMPFKEHVFDTVLCMFSVLNICDYEKTVKEFSRVLKNNGVCIVSVTSVWDKNYSLREKLELNKNDRDGKLVKTGAYKKFKVAGKNIRMKLFRKEELIELFEKNGFIMEYFDSVFILQKPRWNNFRKFILTEKLNLFIERFLPYKDFGCVYVMVFRKVW